jgi:uncharacterized damage-inducible protein DinB
MTTQAERLAARFQSHRRALIALARQLPESAAPFKPWEGAVSTLELLLHIAGTGEFFLASALGREPLAVAQSETIASAAEVLVQLAEKEAAEITIIEAYLPKAVSSEEIQAAVRATIAEMGSPTMKDMGLVMKNVMAKFHAQGARVDGKAVSDMVKQELSKA